MSINPISGVFFGANAELSKVFAMMRRYDKPNVNLSSSVSNTTATWQATNPLSFKAQNAPYNSIYSGICFALEKRPEPKQVPPRTPSLKPQTPNDQPILLRHTDHRALRAEARTANSLGRRCARYELRRSKRRSIGFLIGENGLRITAPRWVTRPT